MRSDEGGVYRREDHDDDDDDGEICGYSNYHYKQVPSHLMQVGWFPNCTAAMPVGKDNSKESGTMPSIQKV